MPVECCALKFRQASVYLAQPHVRIVEDVNVARQRWKSKIGWGSILRAASTLAQTVNRFNPRSRLLAARQVNARSVTALIMLGAAKGPRLKVRAEGEDAREALEAVKTLFEERFGED